MALADLDTVLSRVISILNASPGTYSASISSGIGAFPSQTEINEAVFEADSNVAVYGYFQSANPDLANPFNVVSDPIPHGGNLPFHHGEISLVELSNATDVWVKGIAAANMDDIINAKANESYVQSGAFNFLYNIFAGQLYTTALLGRVTYPEYVKTTALQCNHNETTLLVAEAVKILARNSSPALFEYYAGISAAGFQMLITDGKYTEQGVPVQ